MSSTRTLPFGSLATLFRIVRENGGVDPGRRCRMAALLARYALLEPFRWVERGWVDPRATEHQMREDPIFVLGHWRSGTTYLQQLLALDPRVTSPSLYDSLFADVPTVTRCWLKPALDGVARLLDVTNPIHGVPMDFSAPGETDVSLCSQLSQTSHIWGHLFPRRYELWLDRCVFAPELAVSDAWIEALDRFARKCSWAGGGRRVLLKSPGDTARVGLLARRYPNACFVYIHRDPITVYHSNRGLWEVVRTHYSMQDVTEEQVDGYIVRTYRKLLTRYLEQRDQVSPSRLIELRYETLRQYPEREMSRVYERLGLGSLPEELRDRLAISNDFRTKEYMKDTDLEARLHKDWAFSFEHWPTDSPGPDQNAYRKGKA